MPSRPDPYGGDGGGTGRQTPVATVVIPTHDAEATLADQLTALVGQVDAPPFDVIVVLNRCRDRSRAVAERFSGLLALTILVADERAGVAHARNVGWRAAEAPLVLFCDADDRVGDGWVAGMVEPLLSGRADLVGAKVIVDRRHLVGWHRPIYRIGYEALDGRCVHEGNVPWVIGAGHGIRRSVLEELEGYDEDFDGFAHEEIDLARRLLRAGHRIGPAPAATFAYRPRSTWRGVWQQHRKVVRGWTLEAVKNGVVPGGPRTRWHHRWRIMRKSVRLARRMALRRPLDLVLEVLWRHHQGVLMLELAGSGGPRRLPQHERTARIEATAPVSLPLIGGLLFDIVAAEDVGVEATDHQVAQLGVLERIARGRAGATVIDVGSGVGLFAVGAAIASEAGGSVVTVESNPTLRASLLRNLERHAKSVRPVVGTSLGEVPRDLIADPTLIRLDLDLASTEDVEAVVGMASSAPRAVIVLVSGPRGPGPEAARLVLERLLAHGLRRPSAIVPTGWEDTAVVREAANTPSASPRQLVFLVPRDPHGALTEESVRLTRREACSIAPSEWAVATW